MPPTREELSSVLLIEPGKGQGLRLDHAAGLAPDDQLQDPGEESRPLQRQVQPRSAVIVMHGVHGRAADPGAAGHPGEGPPLLPVGHLPDRLGQPGLADLEPRPHPGGTAALRPDRVDGRKPVAPALDVADDRPEPVGGRRRPRRRTDHGAMMLAPRTEDHRSRPRAWVPATGRASVTPEGVPGAAGEATCDKGHLTTYPHPVMDDEVVEPMGARAVG